MTSKEFIRRCEYYKSLEQACSLITDIDRMDFIFKFDVMFDDSRTTIFNTVPFISFVNSSSVVFYTCERFTRIQFISQLRYFKSFLSRLSSRQLDSLKSSGSFSFLLNFIDNESS